PLRPFVTAPADQSSYGATVNRAAADASGDVLVFLGGLTIPLEGWLAALLETIGKPPRAGAVGGKVLSVEGRIDQAGGAVFSDGSAAGFGSGEFQIDDPLYEYVRDVDYCSDVFFATPKPLFQSLGGFDPSFRAASYAHADYCFRLRGRGERVCY